MSDTDIAMIADLVAQADDTSPAPEQDCPDGGGCTHRCVSVCWRTIYCVPLTAYGDEWPEDVRPRPRQPAEQPG